MAKATTWYHAVLTPVPCIKPVPVVRETEHTIVLGNEHPANARRRKEDGYYKTWECARLCLLSDAGIAHRKALAALADAKSNLALIRKLKP